jgi:chromosome partitioning protein
MFTMSLVGQKGGTGRTTVALGLAVAVSFAGMVTAFIDVDPQATATSWKDRREAEKPAVASAQATRLKQTLETARNGGDEFVMIDTAGPAP